MAASQSANSQIVSNVVDNRPAGQENRVNSSDTLNQVEQIFSQLSKVIMPSNSSSGAASNSNESVNRSQVLVKAFEKIQENNRGLKEHNKRL